MTPSAIHPDSRAIDLRAPAPGSARGTEAAGPAALVSPRLSGRSEIASGIGLTALEARLRGGGTSFAWLSPERELVAGFGAVARFEVSGTDRFRSARRWLESLRSSASAQPGFEHPPLIAVGGFSFLEGSAGAPAGLGDAVFFVPEETWLVLPDRPTRRIVWHSDSAQSAASIPPRSWTRAQLPDWTESEWSDAVLAVLERIREGALEKVVLARSVEIEAEMTIDPARVLGSLVEANPHCFRYLVRPAGGAAFIGASPERLVALSAGDVASDAVAGTAQDAALLDSAKDRSEQAIVVRHILESLAPLCESLQTDPEPFVQRHRHLAHLRTRVTGRARAGVHVLDLVERVHPTPAVAGAPREAALTLLSRHEPSHRGWYAGAVGWMEAGGDGDFAVGIRSALIEGSRALLFAGAGIVAGSEPAAEWTETEVKLAIMREAIADAGR